MATERPTPPIQRRHILPKAATRPRHFSQGGDRETQGERRPKAHKALKMGIKSVLGTQAKMLEASHRSPHHQQALSEEGHEDGAPPTSKTHRKAGRPLGILRPKDGFYALAIHPKDREAFTVNLNGQLLQLCALPMGWSLRGRQLR